MIRRGLSLLLPFLMVLLVLGYGCAFLWGIGK
jgi:hypothetical protein